MKECITNPNEVDWVKIGQDSEKSLVKQVCDYWKIHNDITNQKKLKLANESSSSATVN